VLELFYFSIDYVSSFLDVQVSEICKQSSLHVCVIICSVVETNRPVQNSFCTI